MTVRIPGRDHPRTLQEAQSKHTEKRRASRFITLVSLGALVMITFVLSLWFLMPQLNAEVSPTITVVTVSDGTPGFDADDGRGNDSSASNLRVRAYDSVTFSFEMSLSDPDVSTPTEFDNFTITTTPLPLGFVWSGVPAVCYGTGSQVVGDGVSTQSQLICNMGSRTTGQVFAAQAQVLALPTITEGSTFEFEATVSMDGTPNFASTSSDTITATSLPKLDLQKGGAYFQGTSEVNGVVGGMYAYGVGIKVKKGSEIPATPITFQDDLSSISPNASLIECGLNLAYSAARDRNIEVAGFPIGSYATASTVPGYYPGYVDIINNVSAYSVLDSGTIACSPNAGNSQLVDVSITGTQFGINSQPSFGYNSASPLNSDDVWVVSGYVLIHIPYSEIPEGGSISALNKYINFAPIGSISGLPNFGDATLEPGRGLSNIDTGSIGTENWYQSDIFQPAAGGHNLNTYSYADNLSFTTFVGETAPGRIADSLIGSDFNSGDGVVGHGSVYSSLMYNSFRGILDAPAGYTACTIVDNRYVNVVPVPSAESEGAFLEVDAGQIDAFNAAAQPTVQYGIGKNGGSGVFWESIDQMRDATCNDNDSPQWYDTLDQVPGGASNITKVRVVFQDDYTFEEQAEIINSSAGADSYFFLSVPLQTLETAPLGTDIVTFVKRLANNPEWQDGWSQPVYNGDMASSLLTDKVTVAGSRVKVSKSITDGFSSSDSILAGETSTWFLNPGSESLGGGATGQALGAKVTDVLPNGLSFELESAQCLDDSLTHVHPQSCSPSVTLNSDGSTTLEWNYDPFVSGSELSRISYDTRVAATIINNTVLTNNVAIIADNDNSDSPIKYDSASVSVINPTAFSVENTAITPLVGEDDNIIFRKSIQNTGNASVLAADFINWIPFDGDNRVPSTSIATELELVSVNKFSGSDASILYTGYDTNLLFETDYNPQSVSPSIVWCEAGDFGVGSCPISMSDVTGIRFQYGEIAGGAGSVHDITLQPKDDGLMAVGDQITNRFQGILAGLTSSIESNNAGTTVVNGSIGDTVFFDADGDGVQTENEPGLQGFEITLTDPGDDNLYDTADDITQIDVTDANGQYLFEELMFKEFRVSIDPEVGYNPTSDIDGSGDNQTVFDLQVGSDPIRNRRDVDFGYRGSGVIEGSVFYDDNSDGDKDPGELGLQGMSLSLIDRGNDALLGTADDLTIDTVSTNAQGIYRFEHLLDGDYTVSVDSSTLGVDEGMIVSQKNLSLQLGENSTDNSFGVYQLSQLSGFVWDDANKSGVQDSSEIGVSLVTLNLKYAGPDEIFDTQDDQITSGSTGFDGTYTFEGLVPGIYKVHVTMPNTHILTDQNVGNDELFDSDFVLLDDGNGESPDIIISSNEHVTVVNAGLQPKTTGTIGNQVWEDVNKNGLLDSGEPGVSDVAVEAVWAGADGTFGTLDDQLLTTTTDTNGLYAFADVERGQYQISYQIPSGWVIGPSAGELVDDNNNDGLEVNGWSVTEIFTLNALQDLNTVDAAFVRYDTGSVSGAVWNDVNGNNVRDNGETRFEDVVVRLIIAGSDGILDTPDDLTSTTVTNSEGIYDFQNLLNYMPTRVELVVGTLPTDVANGYVATYEPDGGLDGVIDADLTNQSTYTNLNFGFQEYIPAAVLDPAPTPTDTSNPTNQGVNSGGTGTNTGATQTPTYVVSSGGVTPATQTRTGAVLGARDIVEQSDDAQGTIDGDVLGARERVAFSVDEDEPSSLSQGLSYDEIVSDIDGDGQESGIVMYLLIGVVITFLVIVGFIWLLFRKPITNGMLQALGLYKSQLMDRISKFEHPDDR